MSPLSSKGTYHESELLLLRLSGLSNYSFRSCEGVLDTFRSMFKYSIANKMTLSRTKLSHLNGDGLCLFTDKKRYQI